MEFKDLKSAWDSYSSQEVDKHRLEKENIHNLLKTRSKSLVDRIDRNLMIGMIILGVFIAYIFLDYIWLAEYLSKIIVQQPVKYPLWLEFLDTFSNVLIVTTYLFFVIRYLRIKRSFSADTQLKDLLSGIIDTLKIYRRMFYLALFFLIINIAVGFLAGLYQGTIIKAGALNGGMDSISLSEFIRIAGPELLILIPLILSTYLLLRWGFNKLYGNYLKSLDKTMKELDESEYME
jgi:hypothetical protein